MIVSVDGDLHTASVGEEHDKASNYKSEYKAVIVVPWMVPLLMRGQSVFRLATSLDFHARFTRRWFAKGLFSYLALV